MASLMHVCIVGSTHQTHRVRLVALAAQQMIVRVADEARKITELRLNASDASEQAKQATRDTAAFHNLSTRTVVAR